MSKAEQYIAKIIFRNRILAYKGQQFEDFFVSVMTKFNPNFQPVKAYGNIGDQKNDFEGLYEHWDNICPIKYYFFVTNDKYNGIPAPIIRMAIDLDNNPLYKNINIKTFSAKDLENIFDQLDGCSKQDILGFIPDEIMPVIEFDALNEAVSYLLKTELPETFPDSLIVPDFDEKITFNNLSGVVNHQLVMGSYQENLLMQYFNENPGIKEILQKKFHAFYEQAKKDIPESKEHYADSRFFYILEHACSKRTISIQTSILVLMAYYFSSCDIFEEPE